MMQIRLYLDEDAMARSLIRQFRARGIDTTTAIAEGKLGYDDALQLEFASSQQRTIYTYNISDYARLHTEFLRAKRTHSGIILVHQSRFSLGEQIQRTLKLIATLSAEDIINRAEYLSLWG